MYAHLTRKDGCEHARSRRIAYPAASWNVAWRAQASTVYYRLLDARSGRRSTALATNIDFKAWADYLGDPPLAAAFLDRLVDGAAILKLTGRSYRAHRAQPIHKSDGADQL